MKPKIVVTQKIFPEIAEELQKHFRVALLPQEGPLSSRVLAEKSKDAEGMFSFLTDKIDDKFLTKTPRLKVISNFAVGYNNIDVALATHKRIAVCNTPDVLTEATADLAWALLMALVRRIPQADQFVRSGKFKGWRSDLFLGNDFYGKTLGILGLGRIGRALARRAKGFDMEIVYFDTARSEETEEELRVRFVDIEELLGRSDFISIHAALTRATTYLIGEKELALMKPTAYIINTARGQIIDEKALVEALKMKKIAGAGLDVYEKEPDLTPGLSKLSNVVLLPHIASATLETRMKMAHMACDNLIAFFRRKTPPPHCVNPNYSEVPSAVLHA